MICPECKEESCIEFQSTSGEGLEAPFLVNKIGLCPEGHKFGKKVEVSLDLWHKVQEGQARRRAKIYG